MMYPTYTLGESIILAIGDSTLDGEYRVVRIVYRSYYNDPDISGYYYELPIRDPLTLFNLEFHEKCLRKVHKKATMSFETLKQMIAAGRDY